jgi:aminoglycoside 6'-N-acetyltransferase I
MKISEAKESDLTEWVKLRKALWPHHTTEELNTDSRRILAISDETCFLLIEPSAGAVGFIECKIYLSAPEPYVHVEGWYVEPEFRRQGWGGELVKAVERWSLHHAITKLTSDTNPTYPVSPAAHAKAGFRTLAQFTIFCKDIKGSDSGKHRAEPL